MLFRIKIRITLVRALHTHNKKPSRDKAITERISDGVPNLFTLFFYIHSKALLLVPMIKKTSPNTCEGVQKNHIARVNVNKVRVNDEIRVECHT